MSYKGFTPIIINTGTQYSTSHMNIVTIINPKLKSITIRPITDSIETSLTIK